jgi:hypothetical protein
MQVTVSSLNRHAVASRADVGLPKASVLARHLQSIFPEAAIEANVRMFSQETEEELLGGQLKASFVLDAIDNISTKAGSSILLCSCLSKSAAFPPIVKRQAVLSYDSPSYAFSSPSRPCHHHAQQHVCLRSMLQR